MWPASDILALLQLLVMVILALIQGCWWVSKHRRHLHPESQDGRHPVVNADRINSTGLRLPQNPTHGSASWTIFRDVDSRREKAVEHKSEKESQKDKRRLCKS
ncbi:hypothetical protein BS50DRAFT_572680 [Corynespora cassiicola Philippines]|uniref:Uncharacterized protein n=1 Tax=Corynespora cassiicola Philippines TaxID=1448308 RepID=A0A2T2NQ78_CORCC|nr:hypothetical protein BS50DRAFT_572680 [Corynespora cassiicola Philippines]